VGANQTTTLAAYAPGAVAYRWTKDGVLIEGVTGGSLTVAWEKVPQQSVYAVTPVYSVNGKAVEGTPTTATVKNLPRGMLIYIR